MNTIQIVISDSEPVLVLEHREVSWFARQLIDWHHENSDTSQALRVDAEEVDRNHGAQRHVGVGIDLAERALAQLGIRFKKISPKRFQNMITRGFVHLSDSEIEFFQFAFKHVWFPGVPAEKICEMAATAKEIAASKSARVPHDEGLTPGAYARLLGLPISPGSQDFLREFLGEYFVFRRIIDAPRIVVSHMRVTQDPKACFPAEFVTASHAVGAQYEVEDRVHGIIYHPPEEPDVIFAIGKYLKTTQVRFSILEPTRKLILEPELLPRDMMGIRIGLSRPRRQPLGYSIWCSRLTSSKPDGGWERFAREYVLSGVHPSTLSEMPEFCKRHGIEPQDFFSRHVDGFQEILTWLGTSGHASLHPQVG